MLELDWFLLPFAQDHYDALSMPEKTTFQALLTEKDPDLFAWLMGHTRIDNKEYASLVEKIRAARRICC